MVREQSIFKIFINSFSSMTHFYINSACYLVILNSFRICGWIKIVKTVAFNLLTSIDPS
ncbi:hypothetical protein E2C01_000050 [Portunus trituberculatus]|uniref:Uncharacterized protein n=1 Tax=Portunus trituberculatus TaxID=210409 RepID=A0A5B7CE27_PORTR|nr:hypothetical protein [Portunus trituberculatus]